MNCLYPYIHCIEYYLPEKVLTNNDLYQMFDDKAGIKKICSKIGAQERHIAEDDEFVSDLAVKSAIKLFESNNISPQEIDFIILCTQSPDYLLPTTACTVQKRLNIPSKCGALDINLGCSGFVYALALAKSLIICGVASNILLLMSETYSKHIYPFDKSTRPIFGDGAAAILVKGGSNKQRIHHFVLGTDGEGKDNLIIPAGGMKHPKSAETAIPVKDKFGNERAMNNLYMNGPEIHGFVINLVPQVVKDTLEKNNLTLDDIDLFIFHQASRYSLENLRKKLNIHEHKFYINLTSVGNTVCASIPIALKMAEAEGRVKRGDTVMLVGFGVGYSWGGTVIKW